MVSFIFGNVYYIYTDLTFTCTGACDVSSHQVMIPAYFKDALCVCGGGG